MSEARRAADDPLEDYHRYPPELIPILRRKLEAEARRAELETEKAEQEAALERLRLELEQKKLEIEVRKMQLELDQLEAETRQRVNRATDEEHSLKGQRVYVFSEDIEQKSVQKCIDQLARWSKTGKEMEVVLRSPGGSAADALLFYDFVRGLRQQGCRVRTVALGGTYSAAVVMLQAGEPRAIGRSAELLLHAPWSVYWGRAPEMEDYARHLRELTWRLAEILAERSGRSARYFFERIWKRQWYINAREALKLGLVDEVV